MKILFVCPYMPTLVRTRSFNLVRTLARRGHLVTLATLWENEKELETIDLFERAGVRVITERLTRMHSALNLLRALRRGQPLQSLYCWQPALAQRLVSQMSMLTWDVTHIEHLRGAEYGLYLRKIKSRRELPIVWDSVDCISYLFEQAVRVSRNPFGRFVTRIELPSTRRHEAALLHQFEQVLVTSPQDRAALMELAGTSSTQVNGNHIEVLLNGVDLNYFQPMDLPRHPHSIVLTGKMSYHANATAAVYLVRQVMPLVWHAMPEACVEIVGQNPAPEVQALASADPNRVRVTGTVTDIRPYLAQATLAVAPILYGAGIQNKVLEAMAMATPVVATAKAVSALSVSDGVDVLIGADQHTLAQHIVRLLGDAALRKRMGRQGRLYVEQQHDWDQITAQLEKVYAQVVAVN